MHRTAPSPQHHLPASARQTTRRDYAERAGTDAANGHGWRDTTYDDKVWSSMINHLCHVAHPGSMVAARFLLIPIPSTMLLSLGLPHRMQ